jgi:hypothetical protein
MMEEVLSRSWWRIKVSSVWSWLEDDQELQRVIAVKVNKKYQKKKEERASRDKEERLRKKELAMEVWKIRRKDVELADNQEMDTHDDFGVEKLAEAMDLWRLWVFPMEVDSQQEWLGIGMEDAMDLDQSRVWDDSGMEWSESLEWREHEGIDRVMETLGLELEQVDNTVRFVGVEEEDAHKYLDLLLEELKGGTGEEMEPVKRMDKAGVHLESQVGYESIAPAVLVGGGKTEKDLYLNVDLCNQEAYYGMGSWVVDRWVLGGHDESDRSAVGVHPDRQDTDCNKDKVKLEHEKCSPHYGV